MIRFERLSNLDLSNVLDIEFMPCADFFVGDKHEYVGSIPLIRLAGTLPKLVEALPEYSFAWSRVKFCFPDISVELVEISFISSEMGR